MYRIGRNVLLIIERAWMWVEAAASLLENLRGGFGFDSHLKSALVVVRVLAVVRPSVD